MLSNILNELPLDNVNTAYWVLLVFGVFIAFATLSRNQWGNLPTINKRGGYEIFHNNSRRRFQANAAALIQAGFEKSKNAFCMITDNGPIVVLNSKYAKEIRDDDSLSLSKFTAQEFHADIAGFEPFNVATVEGQLMLDAIKKPLQQALVSRSASSTEVSDALSINWTDAPEWREITLKPSILKIVAQLSSKVFTGDDLCRNNDWHRITITYTIHVYEAAQALLLWPRAIRPLVARFLPACKKLRTQIEESRGMIRSVRAKREKEEKSAGRPSDAIDWMEESARGRSYDPAITQLLLSFAAIHSTADMMTQALYDICEKEELIREMRQEIITVIQERGWTRQALFNLKLMDSVLKESQRLKPTRMISMGRVAEDTIQLSEGLKIAKGTSLMVSSDSMWDANEYSNPQTFDGHRFLRLRQLPEQEKYSQLVSSTPNHMGFGYGKHACPGRFFAANEVKIALCHMLLKYDFRFTDGRRPQIVSQGFKLFTDPAAQFSIRRRKEEISLL